MEARKHEHKIYNASECCVFRKTKELYGGLSNMASGFPLKVNGVHILTSEAIYQACRFPHLPDIQERIIKERSPMSAKMVGKPFRNNSRVDWEDTRIKIMRWSLRVKLAQNFIEFGKLLESTFDKPIVEDSSKDDFWGAIRDKKDEKILKGTNALGRLLMELRQFYNEKRYSYEMFVVEPLNIPNFKLFGQNIETIDERESFISAIKKSTRYFEIENLKTWAPKEKVYPEVENGYTVVKEPEIKQEKKEIKEKTAKKKNTKPTKTKNKHDGQATLPI
ncbi:NADAR family protein [Adhaeribacter sp. BT258]|uniref:NADAR family protein n=1 Tax=Adhaeribacter terrigena TaxID=2793070 RepID=A0ABS1C2D9_9BACT|nr:NADAR family protein [Adhaeribacter terrigena]MBK0403571.1 NADAR family protein [Adhaeribacter terrigena]